MFGFRKELLYAWHALHGRENHGELFGVKKRVPFIFQASPLQGLDPRSSKRQQDSARNSA